MDEDEKFSKWSELPFTVRNLVVSKLDYETRRSLRACSLNDYHLVNGFLFHKISHMSIVLNEETAAPEDGKKSYKLMCNVGVDSGTPTTIFESAEELAEALQRIIMNIESIQCLKLDITGLSAPIQLARNLKKISVKTLHLALSCDPVVVTEFMSRFKTESVENFYLEGQGLPEGVLESFELTAFNSLSNTQITDAQLLRLRARHINLLGCTSLTVSGLRRFLKKMLRRGETTKLFCANLSDELKDLFDYTKRNGRHRFHIRLNYCYRTLRLWLTDSPLPSPTVLAEIISRYDVDHDPPDGIGEDLLNFILSVEFDF